MYLQTVSVLFAHSRAGFVLLLCVAAMSSGFFWLNPQPGASAGVDAGVFAASIAAMLLCTWLFAFGVLLGAAVSRVDHRVDAWRLPLAREVLRRCTLAVGGLLVSLALVPAMARLPASQAAWLLPCLAGAFASFLLAGLAIALLEGRRSVGILGGLGFVALLSVWPRAMQSWGPALSQPEPSLRVGLAATGLLLLAGCGWVARRWLQAARSTSPKAGSQGLPGAPRGTGLIVPAQRARIRMWAGIGTPDPARWDALVMPAASRLTRQDWLAAGGIALLFAFFNTTQKPGSVMLIIWLAIASIGGTVYAQGSWVSPRVLLLPGGLRRQGMAQTLFWHAIRRSLPRCAAMTMPSMLAMWLLTPLGALPIMAMALTLPGSLVLSSAVAVDAIRRTDIWQRSTATILQFLPLSLCAIAADILGWVTPDGPLTDWLVWALATSVSLAAAGALWLALTARSLQRLDAGRLTPLSSPSAG